MINEEQVNAYFQLKDGIPFTHATIHILYVAAVELASWAKVELVSHIIVS